MQSRKLKVFICCLSLLFLFPGLAAAKLERKTVEAHGSGITVNQAIYDAIHEAVARINGESIETKQQLDSVSATLVENDKAERYDAEVMQQKIKTATKGVIEGYDIVEQSKDADGLWNVVVKVTVMKFVGHNSDRKRIAIFPLRIGSGNFSSNGRPIDPERIGRITTQNIASSLVQSRRFTVLDREYIVETVGEQGLALSANTPVSEMARLGQEMVADYILVGTLESIAFTEKSVKMQSTGRELISRQGVAELSVRILDISTREVVFSDFLKLKLSESDLERFGGSLLDDGVESNIAIVVGDKVGRKVLDTVYPLMVVAVDGQSVTIGQGGSHIKEGDKLEMYMLGDWLKDPYTKEHIGRQETLVGSVEVVRVNPKISLAKVVEASVDLAGSFQENKFICRATEGTSENKEAARAERHKQRENKRKDRDKDW